jgi:hypothetical protein
MNCKHFRVHIGCRSLVFGRRLPMTSRKTPTFSLKAVTTRRKSRRTMTIIHGVKGASMHVVFERKHVFLNTLECREGETLCEPYKFYK